MIVFRLITDEIFFFVWRTFTIFKSSFVLSNFWSWSIWFMNHQFQLIQLILHKLLVTNIRCGNVINLNFLNEVCKINFWDILFKLLVKFEGEFEKEEIFDIDLIKQFGWTNSLFWEIRKLFRLFHFSWTLNIYQSRANSRFWSYQCKINRRRNGAYSLKLILIKIFIKWTAYAVNRKPFQFQTQQNHCKVLY